MTLHMDIVDADVQNAGRSTGLLSVKCVSDSPDMSPGPLRHGRGEKTAC